MGTSGCGVFQILEKGEDISEWDLLPRLQKVDGCEEGIQ